MQFSSAELPGPDWSKANDLIAFNAKGSDGRYHVYTVKPDGANRQQPGVGSATLPQRTTGTPARSPSGQFIAFVAEKWLIIEGFRVPGVRQRPRNAQLLEKSDRCAAFL